MSRRAPGGEGWQQHAAALLRKREASCGVSRSVRTGSKDCNQETLFSPLPLAAELRWIVVLSVCRLGFASAAAAPETPAPD